MRVLGVGFLDVGGESRAEVFGGAGADPISIEDLSARAARLDSVLASDVGDRWTDPTI